MKKIFHCLLIFLISLSFVGCGLSENESVDNDNTEISTDEDYEEDPETGDYTNSVDDIKNTDGFYILQNDKNTIRYLPIDYTSRLLVDGFNGTSYPGSIYDGDAYICWSIVEPCILNNSDGEEIIFTSRTDQSVKIEFCPISFIGYGDEDVFGMRTKLSEFETINGIDVSEINNDNLSIFNDAVSSEGIHAYPVEDEGSYYQLLLSSEVSKEIEYSLYEGTNYNTYDVTMNYSYYLGVRKQIIDVYLNKTTDGYFIMDLSNVPKGMYFVNIKNVGEFILNLQ